MMMVMMMMMMMRMRMRMRVRMIMIGPEPRTTLCASPSTFHKRHQKSHFMQKFTGKLPQPRLSPERGHTFCARLRSRNACRDVTRATLCRNLQETCRSPAGSHKRDPHFVRACEIEMHINISQETSEERLYAFMRKFTGTERGHTFRASLLSRNACQDFIRATLY